MNPNEIKPDTKLSTIIGYQAQTGKLRKYFNKILKYYEINATAIALNINETHIDATLKGVKTSKIKEMLISNEFQKIAISYCDTLNEDAKEKNYIDFIEVKGQKSYGFCFEEKAKKLYKEPKFIDDETIFITKLILIANRWFNTPIDIDIIPKLIGENSNG